ncbi:hypothetical protein AVEN_62118-1 [Araneus ventricosus]|uniref:Uncharacterized protein n=1 Tax=Araneus ventricosus TaxID=182803 RepID=A0A4Y2VGH8_ARAVE|nr:hypothetical protein AVEN_62118-1 [Araneus ventricosus]
MCGGPEDGGSALTRGVEPEVDGRAQHSSEEGWLWVALAVVLSTCTSNPRQLMFAVNPTSCEDLRRYSGYPSCPVYVSIKKWREYSFVQILSFIYAERGFILPHVPCAF